jgi:hypothetical protein
MKNLTIQKNSVTKKGFFSRQFRTNLTLLPSIFLFCGLILASGCNNQSEQSQAGVLKESSEKSKIHSSDSVLPDVSETSLLKNIPKDALGFFYLNQENEYLKNSLKSSTLGSKFDFKGALFPLLKDLAPEQKIKVKKLIDIVSKLKLLPTAEDKSVGENFSQNLLFLVSNQVDKKLLFSVLGESKKRDLNELKKELSKNLKENDFKSQLDSEENLEITIPDSKNVYIATTKNQFAASNDLALAKRSLKSEAENFVSFSALLKKALQFSNADSDALNAPALGFIDLDSFFKLDKTLSGLKLKETESIPFDYILFSQKFMSSLSSGFLSLGFNDNSLGKKEVDEFFTDVKSRLGGASSGLPIRNFENSAVHLALDSKLLSLFNLVEKNFGEANKKNKLLGLFTELSGLNLGILSSGPGEGLANIYVETVSPKPLEVVSAIKSELESLAKSNGMPITWQTQKIGDVEASFINLPIPGLALIVGSKDNKVVLTTNQNTFKVVATEEVGAKNFNTPEVSKFDLASIYVNGENLEKLAKSVIDFAAPFLGGQIGDVSKEIDKIGDIKESVVNVNGKKDGILAKFYGGNKL